MYSIHLVLSAVIFFQNGRWNATGEHVKTLQSETCFIQLDSLEAEIIPKEAKDRIITFS